jgi:hypothetical protein
VDDIAQELELYVSRHPAAADTIAGIARWWLARPVQPAIGDVQLAVDRLVSRRVLVRRTLPDGNCVYMRGARAAGA